MLEAIPLLAPANVLIKSTDKWAAAYSINDAVSTFCNLS